MNGTKEGTIQNEIRKEEMVNSWRIGREKKKCSLERKTAGKETLRKRE